MATTEIVMPTELTFSDALKACREGAKIARKGWNGAKLGKVAFIVHQKAYPTGIEINANSAEALGLPEKTVCAFEPYLMLAVKLDEGDERRGEKGCEFIHDPENREHIQNLMLGSLSDMGDLVQNLDRVKSEMMVKLGGAFISHIFGVCPCGHEYASRSEARRHDAQKPVRK